MNVRGDSAPEAAEVLRRRARAMTPSQRVDEGVKLCKLEREIMRGGIRRRHPDHDEAEGNIAGDDGGGVYLTTRARVGMKDCAFDSNKAAGNGGGLRLTFGALCVVLRCRFWKNQANTDAHGFDGGGAIASGNAILGVRSCTLEKNRCQGFAGAGIYFITRKYDSVYERGAKLIHGWDFETLLKDKYGIQAVGLSSRTPRSFSTMRAGRRHKLGRRKLGVPAQASMLLRASATLVFQYW